MKKVLTGLSCFLMGLSAQAEKPQAVLPEKNFDFLANYCLNCHDEEKQEGKVNLEDLDFNITTIEQAEQWQSVLSAINAGDMPPEDKKQPNSHEKADFLESLSDTMVTARKVLSDSGGKITMSRLNKREYKNSIQSLVGVELDENILPSDDGSTDFDTVGASLFMSGDKFEQYLKLGRKSIDEFYEQRAAQNAKPFVYRIEAEDIGNPKLKQRLKKSDELFKKFEALKKAVDEFAARPENAEAIAKMSKKDKAFLRRYYEKLSYLDGAPHPKDFGLKYNLFNAAKFYELSKNDYEYHKHFHNLPHRENGTYLQLNYGVTRLELVPEKMPVGTYKLRVSAGAVEGSPAYRNFLEFGHPGGPIDDRGDFEGFPIKAIQVQGSVTNPKVIETEFEVRADTQREFAIRERRPTSWHELRKVYHAEKKRNGYGHEPSTWVDWVEIEGPIAKPQSGKLTKIYDAYRDKEGLSDIQRARYILTEFSKEAFRTNKARPEFIESVMAIFKNRLTMEKDFDIAIRTPLSIIVSSPRFIYKNEVGYDKTRQLSNLEAAVRLSYFLWSSPPDAELLNVVKQNKLSNVTVLRQQVERMLKDPKAHRFVAGLTHQWLDMQRLDLFQFSVTNFREFDQNLRRASREEVYQTILHLLRSKDSGQLHKLIKSDFVVVNGMMAAHYGMTGIEGEEFRKVELLDKSPRGGLLGMAAISAMGSDGMESSPVERGAWVLRYMLNDPPPPAPANVPQLSRLADKKISKKEKLIAHQEEPQCASCHRKIDPIGFGLENFNAIGQWRTKDKHAISKTNKKGIVDASGAFHKGPSFADFFELRDRIYDKKDDFARGFSEALIEYGLGRPYAFTDEDLTQKILSTAKSKDYNMNEFVQALVSSKQFWTK